MPVELDDTGGVVADRYHQTAAELLVAATAERLAEFRSRPFDDAKWLVMFIDGFDFAGHTMVGALGLSADGTKVALGVVEGWLHRERHRGARAGGRPARPWRGRLRRSGGRHCSVLVPITARFS